MTDDTIPTGDPTTVPMSALEELVEDWEWNGPGLMTVEDRTKDVCAKRIQDLINEHDPKQ